jgi:LCP family protein required for cell wall assembly
MKKQKKIFYDDNTLKRRNKKNQSHDSSKKINKRGMKNKTPIPPGKRQKKKKAPVWGCLRNTLIVIVVLLLVLGIGGYTFVSRFVNQMNSEKLDYEHTSELYINDHVINTTQDLDVVNIAVFGIDGRAGVEGDRSDAIMILSLDYENNAVKITSLMRDTYVNIPDYGYTKINAAYSYGGAELALKTINLNYDMNITDYIIVDFNSMIMIVDAIGGVDIDVDSDELYWTNIYIDDVNSVMGTSSAHLTDTGVQNVNGVQALAYCRVRYTDNGDFDRTERQREVFNQMLSKMFTLGPLELYNMVDELTPYITHSMDQNEMIYLGIKYFLMDNPEIEQSRYPLDDELKGGIYTDGVYYMFPDTLAENVISLYEYIFEIDYEPSFTLQDISNEIEEAIYWW